MKNKTAIYPGTFDPPTFGHLDIIERSAQLFDEVIVSIAASSSKKTLFTVNERLEMLKKITSKYRNVKADSFKGLLVMHAAAKNVSAIIRGLRAVSDFEYELQMALTNRKLNGKITTIFLTPGEKYSYLSSTLVREIAANGGNLSHFVPPLVVKKLKAKFK